MNGYKLYPVVDLIRDSVLCKEPACEAVIRLLCWLEQNGLASYDPDDFKGNKDISALVMQGRLGLRQRVKKLSLYSLSALFPHTFRRAMGVKKEISASGMAYLALAFIELSKHLNDSRITDNICLCLNWLSENSASGYSGSCWGVPFDWPSYVLVSANTPLAHTTVTCGEAYFQAGVMLKRKDFIDVARGVCDYLINDLNVLIDNDVELAFSYGIHDKAAVVNANMDISKYLMKVGSYLGDNELTATAVRLANTCVKAQNADGSWYYAIGQNVRGFNVIDNYHTAMVLRAINDLIEYDSDADRRGVYRKSLSRGIKYYLTKLFDKHCVPLHSTGVKYPIDIHSCALALLLMNDVSGHKDLISEYNISEINRRLLKWVLHKMRMRDGAFVYRRYYFKKVPLKSIRWGQSIMLYALIKRLCSAEV